MHFRGVLMKSLTARLKLFRRDEKGLTILEYAIGAAFISLVIIAGAASMTGGVKAFFTGIGTSLSGASTTINPN